MMPAESRMISSMWSMPERFFDFRDQLDARFAFVGQQPLDVHHILPGAHEGERDEVQLVLHRELDVRPVLVGQVGHVDVDAGQVNALVVGERPAAQHPQAMSVPSTRSTFRPISPSSSMTLSPGFTYWGKSA